MNTQQIKSIKPPKKPSKVSRILALSEKGFTPLEISKTLDVKLHYVYTARAQMKAKGIGHWHQNPSVQQPKPTHKPAHKPTPIKTEPTKPVPAPFFSRLKAAYAALKGDVK